MKNDKLAINLRRALFSSATVKTFPDSFGSLSPSKQEDSQN